MNKLSTVFWDVDGTIADTELYGHRVAFNLAFKYFGLNWYWNENKYIDLLKISGGYKRIIHFRDEIKSEITNEECSRIQSKKRNYYEELIQSGKIKIRDGVLRLIEELGSFNVQQVIVTTSGSESLEPLLNTTLKSYLNFFSNFITYENVSSHKPSPEAYELAIKLSKNHPNTCIAIEDSRIGVDAAKAANLNCLLTLPTWYSNFNNIPKHATACVDTIGNKNRSSKVIYGKTLNSKIVDFNYLTRIIN